MPELDAPVMELILEKSDLPPKAIATEIKNTFGASVPLATIRGVLMAPQRREDIDRAKNEAASTLGQKLDRIEAVSEKLDSMFNDPLLSIKERIEASKELRQWTKLGIDSSGIHDKDTGYTFVISQEWDTSPKVEDGD